MTQKNQYANALSKKPPFQKLEKYSPGLSRLTRGVLFLGSGIPVIGILFQLALRRGKGIPLGRIKNDRLVKTAELFEYFWVSKKNNQKVPGKEIFRFILCMIIPPALFSIRFWFSPLYIAFALLRIVLWEIPKAILWDLPNFLFGFDEKPDQNLQPQEKAQKKSDKNIIESAFSMMDELFKAFDQDGATQKTAPTPMFEQSKQPTAVQQPQDVNAAQSAANKPAVPVTANADLRP